ncbi:MAG: hypothetical protein WCC84_09935 [Candidatus Cybelea sp.]
MGSAFTETNGKNGRFEEGASVQGVLAARRRPEFPVLGKREMPRRKTVDDQRHVAGGL